MIIFRNTFKLHSLALFVFVNNLVVLNSSRLHHSTRILLLYEIWNFYKFSFDNLMIIFRNTFKLHSLALFVFVNNLVVLNSSRLHHSTRILLLYALFLSCQV